LGFRAAARVELETYSRLDTLVAELLAELVAELVAYTRLDKKQACSLFLPTTHVSS
jgi:hypothetical protein